MSAGEILQPASGTRVDWSGTASAEGSIVAGDLHQIVGLPAEHWLILAIDIFGFAEYGDDVVVYALSKTEHGIDSYADLMALEAREGGSLPVTGFAIHGLTHRDVVNCMKTLHVQLRFKTFGALRVTGRIDLPRLD